MTDISLGGQPDATASAPCRSGHIHSLRRITVRLAACSALSALGLGVLSSGPVSAAPLAPAPMIEAPLLASAITGLSQGARGDDVRALQQALIDAGVTVRGGADGIFGPATRQAVIDFQNARGLSTSGTVDSATADALASSSGTATGGDTGNATGGDSSGSGYVGLARGATGELVVQVQTQLIRFGVYLGGGADGDFDGSTERGVRQFQRWNGLGVTGTVTQATAKALGLVDGAPAPAPPPADEPAPDPEPTGASEYVGLKRGSRGEAVKDVQTAIQSKGYVIRGGADGIFGQATEAVLKAYQRANGVDQTGVVGEQEVALLGLGSTVAPPTPAPDSPSSGDRYIGLKLGARGAAVTELQQALIDAGITVRGGADAERQAQQTGKGSNQSSMTKPRIGRGD